MLKPLLFVALVALTVSGCHDTDFGPARDVEPPVEAGLNRPPEPTPNSGGPISLPTSAVDPERTPPLVPGAVAEAPNTPEAIAKQWDRQAKAEYTAGNFDAAVASLRQAIKLDPQNRTYSFHLGHVMTTQAQVLTKAGDIQRGYSIYVEVARLFREAGLQNPKYSAEERQFVANAVYNEACAYALEGKSAKALDTLRESVEVGFHDLNLMRSDADLKSLHETPEFKSLLEESRQKLQEKAKVEVRELFANSEPIPFDFDLPDLDDKKLSLSQLKGKVVLAHIWAVECPFCQREVPNYIALQKEFGDQGLQVVGLTYQFIPGADSKTSIREFVAKTGINYPCLIGDDEVKRQVMSHRAFPIAYFVDRGGVTRIHLAGNQPLVKLQTIVSTLLAEPAPNPESPAKSATGD